MTPSAAFIDACHAGYTDVLEPVNALGFRMTLPPFLGCPAPSACGLKGRDRAARGAVPMMLHRDGALG